MNKVFLLFVATISCANISLSSFLKKSDLLKKPEINFNIKAGTREFGNKNNDPTLRTETVILESPDVMVEDSNESMLQAGFIPGTKAHVKVVSLQNDTNSSEFKVFYGAGLSRGTSFPGTKLTFSSALPLIQNTPITFQCSRGSYLMIYLKDEGLASGQVEDGFEGPYCLSMWLGYPQVDEQEKVYIRYAVKSDRIGQVGVKIGSKGECQILALEDVVIL